LKESTRLKERGMGRSAPGSDASKPSSRGKGAHRLRPNGQIQDGDVGTAPSDVVNGGEVERGVVVVVLLLRVQIVVRVLLVVRILIVLGVIEEQETSFDGGTAERTNGENRLRIEHRLAS